MFQPTHTARVSSRVIAQQYVNILGSTAHPFLLPLLFFVCFALESKITARLKREPLLRYALRRTLSRTKRRFITRTAAGGKMRARVRTLCGRKFHFRHRLRFSIVNPAINACQGSSPACPPIVFHARARVRVAVRLLSLANAVGVRKSVIPPPPPPFLFLALSFSPLPLLSR